MHWVFSDTPPSPSQEGSLGSVSGYIIPKKEEKTRKHGENNKKKSPLHLEKQGKRGKNVGKTVYLHITKSYLHTIRH